jgi:pimeloyl-ACP methyl ester carboxylesterase
MGDALALHAERSRGVQRRSLFLQGGRRHSRSRGSDRRAPTLLTGEYDYSCTTEGTLDVARRTGAEVTIMRGLGHFPMSEDPGLFITYLLPVLERIRGTV